MEKLTTMEDFECMWRVKHDATAAQCPCLPCRMKRGPVDGFVLVASLAPPVRDDKVI